jgi:soluble lytic murein transglycosylase-like protein
MRSSRDSYVHRGDQERRTKRVRLAIMLAGLVVTVVIAIRDHGPRIALAEGRSLIGHFGETSRLREELDAARGELDLAHTQIARWTRIFGFSSRFAIPADLATSIYDIALAEGIEPELAFRLVRVESEFNERATSPVGAIGLTQVMPATARYFEKAITRDRLYRRDVNLRIGFRYLRTLIREYKGNVQLALLVYNRGPAAVTSSREQGLDPSNGYDRVVMRGYRGKGVVD